MLASSLFRVLHPPVVVGSLAMMWGYVRSAMTGKQRYDDQDFRRFLRGYQWNCLLKGKSRATRELNERQASRWSASSAGGLQSTCIVPTT
jgi:hypothetical protein